MICHIKSTLSINQIHIEIYFVGYTCVYDTKGHILIIKQCEYNRKLKFNDVRLDMKGNKNG